MTQQNPNPDIHAGAVSPMRNGLQVGGLAGAAVLASGGEPFNSFLALFATALLASAGSTARTRLRNHEAKGTQPNFLTNVLLTTLSVLG